MSVLLQRVGLLDTVAAGGAFTPASLANIVFWADASDTSTLWTDTGGTTQVTTDGESVARLDDKSGEGNNVTQTTASHRPQWKNDGSLLFDGVDDRLAFANLTLARNIGAISLVTGYQINNIGRAASQVFFLASTNSNPNVARVFLYNSASSIRIGGRRRDSDSFDSIGVAHDTTAHTVAGLWDIANADLTLRVDGVQAAQNLSFQTAGVTNDTDSGGIVFGSLSTLNETVDGRVYQKVITQSVLSGGDLTDTESFVADKLP